MAYFSCRIVLPEADTMENNNKNKNPNERANLLSTYMCEAPF